MLQIDFNPTTAATAIKESGLWFTEAMLTDRDARFAAMQEVRRALLAADATPAECWFVPGRPDLTVMVSGDFTADGEGLSTDEGYLDVSALLSPGGPAAIGGISFDNMWDLLGGEDIDGGVGVFIGVRDRINEAIRNLAALIAPMAPDVPDVQAPASLPDSLGLRILTVDGIRGESTGDPGLTAEESAVLDAATDDAITEAIDAAFPSYENQFYAIHDGMQADVKAALFSAAEV